MAKRAWRYWEPTFQADKVCEMNPVWPWGGHRAFGYDLVRWMRPARIAELGVHWGTSFFAFAQAVKDGRMKQTELIGVDTFEGEEHAGQYGPEVLETVRRIVREHFAGQQITLHKSLFSEALPKVEDESVDLIHIDGLHTYEAVKEDFETWLPKLAPEGIVLFHDVAPDTGYGSTDYWNELVEQHPGFAFHHSWGLGVLFPKGRTRLDELEKLGIEDKLLVYSHRARAERAQSDLEAAQQLAVERMRTIENQRQTAQERSAQAEKLRADLEAARKLARERYEALEKQSEVVKQRGTRIETLTHQLENARKLAQDRLESLNQAAARAAQAEKSGAKLEARAAAAEAARDELRERVRVQDERITQLRDARAAMQQRNDEMREQNAGLRETLAAERATLAELRRDLEHSRRATEKRLAEVVEHLAALAASHERDREGSRGALAALAEAVEQARRSGEAAAATLAGRISRLDTDAELLSVRAEHLEEIVADQRDRHGRLGEQPPPEHDWLTGEARPAQRRSPKRS